MPTLNSPPPAPGSPPAPPASGSPPLPPASGSLPPPDVIKDTTTAEFVTDVIEASRTTPVIVDFWAPWCEPCKQLTPRLEAAVRSAGGAVRLVKLDIDAHPQIAQQMRLQSVPAVIAFRNGQPVDGFVSAVPDSQVRRFVEQLCGAPSGTDGAAPLVEAGQAALAAGDLAAAAQAFAQALQQEAGCPAAVGGLARCYLANNDPERARQTLALAAETHKDHSGIAAATAALALHDKARNVGGAETLQARLQANAGDHAARFDLALALHAGGQNAQAVDHLLTIVTQDRAWNDEAARKQLLEMFAALGHSDPLTLDARRRLSAILFQ